MLSARAKRGLLALAIIEWPSSRSRRVCTLPCDFQRSSISCQLNQKNHKNIAVKFAVIDDKDHPRYSKNEPLPKFSLPKGNAAERQVDFDSSIPFSSIYLDPPIAPNELPHAKLASTSSTGVIAFHGSLMKLYEEVLLETKPSSPAHATKALTVGSIRPPRFILARESRLEQCLLRLQSRPMVQRF